MTQALYMGLFGARDLFTMWSYLYIMIMCRMTPNMWLFMLAISTKTEGTYINWCIIECFVVLNLMLACQNVMWYVCLINKISTNLKCPKYREMDRDLCSKMNSCEFTHWEFDFWRCTWKIENYYLTVQVCMFVIWMHKEINMYEWLCLF